MAKTPQLPLSPESFPVVSPETIKQIDETSPDVIRMTADLSKNGDEDYVYWLRRTLTEIWPNDLATREVVAGIAMRSFSMPKAQVEIDSLNALFAVDTAQQNTKKQS